jgi:hypothetical protein
VDCVTERIEDRGDVAIDVWFVMPNIRHGQNEIFGECTGSIDTYTLGIFAKMAATCEAVSTATAYHVTFTADDFAREKVVNIIADRYNFTDKFMADDHGDRNGLLGPSVPFVDMQVGPADSSAIDADQHIVDTVLGNRDLFQPQAGLRMAFDQGLHCLDHINLACIL